MVRYDTLVTMYRMWRPCDPVEQKEREGMRVSPCCGAAIGILPLGTGRCIKECIRCGKPIDPPQWVGSSQDPVEAEEKRKDAPDSPSS
jgi:hypothetical protein